MVLPPSDDPELITRSGMPRKLFTGILYGNMLVAVKHII
jgi:hypothetical protein